VSLEPPFPVCLNSAALLGPGSEVLGFHDEMSKDHNWEPHRSTISVALPRCGVWRRQCLWRCVERRTIGLAFALDSLLPWSVFAIVVAHRLLSLCHETSPRTTTKDR
jgi:hypothetical protein